MEPVILDSARRHGITDEDMLHAYRNAVYAIVDEDDEVTLHFGGDHAGNLLEIGAVESDEGVVVIIHAMPARPHKIR